MEQTDESVVQQSAYWTGLLQEELKRVLNYDTETGVFTWKITIGGRSKIGDVAGSWSGTYYTLNIYGQKYYLHVLAWFYITGVWCKVDHKDRDKSNNRFVNLRAATTQQNAWNQEARGTNLLGVKGVQQRGNKFRAYITVDYKTIHLGTYVTLEEAINARQTASAEFFGEFASG